MSWQAKPVGDLFEVVGGGTPSKKKPEFYGGNIPWATIRDMHSSELSATEHTITEAGLRASSAKVIPAGEVIMASRVGLGKACLLEQDTAINQDIRALLPKKPQAIDRRFCLYWLQSIEATIIGAGSGATVQGVKLPFIKSLPFPVIGLEEQKRIVAVLDQVFAALDHARANAEANLIDSKQIFDAALDKIVDHKSALGDYVSIRTGKLNANAAVEGGRYPFFTCSRDVFAIDSFAFDCEAILLAGNNASGDFNVKHFDGKFNAYQRTYVIQIDDTSRLDYRFLYFQMIRGLKELKKGSVGANTKFLKIGMITDLAISVPPIDEQKVLVSKLDAIKATSETLQAHYRQALEDERQLRQSILQKAFAGELT